MKCEICNKEFKDIASLSRHIKIHNIKTKEYYDKYLKKEDEGICPVCGKPTIFLKLSKGYQKFCGNSCAMKSPETQTKFNKTMKDKYGVEWAAQSKEIYDKVLQTNEQKYGEKFHLNRTEVKENLIKCAHTEEANEKRLQSLQNTLKEKYNVTTAFQIPEIYEKCHNEEINKKRTKSIHNRTIEDKHIAAKKHNLTVQKNIEEFEKSNNCTWKTTLINKYGQGWLSIKDDLIILYDKSRVFIDNSCIYKIEEYYNSVKSSYVSKGEKEIVNYIKSIYNGIVLENDKKIIHPYELDIYLPEINIAIEFNGTYWHSSKCGKDKNYHLKKSKLCEKKGIKLIHIFEFEWEEKQEICKSLISSALNLYKYTYDVKQCTIKLINKNISNNFLLENHIHGSTESIYQLGLLYNDELIQLICINYSKTQNKYELVRICTKLYSKVINGFNTLIDYQPFEYLIYYLDRSKFFIENFLNNKFIVTKYTKPKYMYWKHDIGLITQDQLTKPYVTKLLGKDKYLTQFNINENMIINSFYQLFDCGDIEMEYRK